MIVELPYSLHTRKASIAISWTIILIPPVFLNLALFYGLWYGKPNMDRMTGNPPLLTLTPTHPAALPPHETKLTNPVLTLPTLILGIFTILSILERIYKLAQPSPKFRPLDSPRYALDVFQWGYFGALILISSLIMSTLARADSDDDGHAFQIRLLSLPTCVLMFYLAVLTLLSLVLSALGVGVPFRMGSVSRGEPVRPAVYYVVEDVVAVDGFGGSEYRAALMGRYAGSEVFRFMVWRVSVVWMIVLFGLGILFTGLVMRLPVVTVYAVGWAGPFPCAAMLGVWTIFYVKGCLRLEREVEGRKDGGQQVGSGNGSVGEGVNGNANGNRTANVIAGGGGERAPLLTDV